MVAEQVVRSDQLKSGVASTLAESFMNVLTVALEKSCHVSSGMGHKKHCWKIWKRIRSWLCVETLDLLRELNESELTC